MPSWVCDILLQEKVEFGQIPATLSIQSCRKLVFC